MRIVRLLALTTLTFVALASAALAAAPTRTFAPVQDGPNAQASPRPVYREGRLIVQFHPDAAATVRQKSVAGGTGIASVDALAMDHALKGMRALGGHLQNRALAAELGADRWYTMDFATDIDMEALAAEFRADPSVSDALPDYYAFPAAVPNDTDYSYQWGHNNTGQMASFDWGGTWAHTGPPVGTVGFDSNAEAAWSAAQGYGDPGVVIAILDTGVDLTHPDLNLVAGYDWGDNDSDPSDDSADPGHGTACAGVAAAIANNALGVAGVAGGSSIMPVKVADSSGALAFSYIIDGVYWAADNGADVISMSLGAEGLTSYAPMDAAVTYAWNAGVVLLAATGNANNATIDYPSTNPQIIAVGAASPCGDRKRSSDLASEVNPGVSTDPNGATCDEERWWGSNYGATTANIGTAVDVIAPTIVPTTDISGSGGYSSGDYDRYFNGTSCATPYAAGVCALIVAANPTATPTQIRDNLRNNAMDIVNVESGAGWDRYTGYGMVDASASVGPPVNPPSISIAPTTMAFALAPDATDNAPFTISNVAAAPADDLNWQLSTLGCGWMSIDVAAGTTAQGGSDIVTVTADATGLAPGVYNCTLRVLHDDSSQPLIFVPVELTVAATDVDVAVSTAAPGPVALLTNPEGTGAPLSSALSWDGVVGNPPVTVDATISVTLTQGGAPVVGHPADQIQLVASAGGWSLCPGTNQADGPTNASGTTTFSGALAGGGYSASGEVMQVVVSGVTVGTVTYAGGGAGLDIRVNSPDNNNSGLVDLADVGTFSIDFNGYDFRSDLQWDGVHNLVDVGALALDYGSSCVGVASTAPALADARVGLYFDRAGTSRATELEVGREIVAYLLLDGPLSQRGLTAFDLSVESTRNVMVHEIVPAAGGLNFGEGRKALVGVGSVQKSVAAQPLLLATVRLSVIDDAPASLSLRSGRQANEQGLPMISDGSEVFVVPVVSGAANAPVAFLNDDAAGELPTPIAAGLALRNQPNPFNPSTEILFNLPRKGRADVRIYDVSGRLVAQLGGEELDTGANTLHWNGTDRHGSAVVSGLYFYRLFLDGESLGSAKKMSLLK